MDIFLDEYIKADLVEKAVRELDTDENGVVTKTETVTSATTSKGTHAKKVITIDDESGYTSEVFNITNRNGHSVTVNEAGLTRYRCARMTVAAIKMLYGAPKQVGFIGTGRTNLANCIAIKNAFGVDSIVIKGSKRNPYKNAGDYMTVCENVMVDVDFSLLNSCDVVVVCTSSFSKKDCISVDLLNGPNLIVCLDCGYFLDESFRKCKKSYTDFAEQIERHYRSEFPFDKKRYGFSQMRFMDKPVKDAVVYLYGVSIADAVAAERFLEAIGSV